MQIAYIIYNERPLSGLVRTQVLSLLKEIKRQAPETSLTLVSFWQPWVALRFRKAIDGIRTELSEVGIKVENYPWAIIPSRHFLYKIKLFPIVYWWAYWLFRLVLSERFDIVHCRAHFPSLIAASLKEKLGFRCIFDMRSFWAKEHVTNGAWSEKDEIYKMWEHLERLTIARSDASVGVSVSMVEGINRIVPDARGVLIPICVDTRDLRFDESARDGLRRQFNWDNRSIVAYQGSLGLLNRNISNIVEYIGFIREICSNAYFLILTPKDNHRAVAYLMGEHGIPSSQFLVIEPASGELHRWLSAADVGIHAMSAGPDSQTRLGVKVVEYLSCGLPVLVNANVGAAASLIDTHHVGAVIDLEKRVESQISIDRLFSQSHSLRQQCRKVAEDLFSVEVCASKYIDLYKELGNR